MLMLAETFAEQAAGAIALHCTADFLARDHAQFGRGAIRQ